ncbi:CD98 heavy chain [Musca autumnalis]|uniref:CD98 heavy chain n=1 Tax=Musca autumnalis TaxID=221902 RepID=UPI003CEF761C
MMKILAKNKRKVNVSTTESAEAADSRTKEVEVFKSISEDSNDKPVVLQRDSESKEDVHTTSTSSLSTNTASTENIVDNTKGSDYSSTDTKMVQEEINNDGADEQMLGAEDNDKLAEKREEVKFIKGGDHQNGDAKIDIGVVNGKAFTGMTKEELMKYANDPFWIRLRWIFFITFWLLWLGMLVGAILIIVETPKCAAPEPLPWYKSGILAKFSNFESSNENVELVKQIKASGVIYEMPAELTYNVRDADVEEKIRNIVNHYKDTEAQVIFDITPNYVPKTSRLVKDAMDDETKRSAFVWIEKPEVPNNWLSLVNGSAWAEVMPGNYVLSQFGDGLYDLHMNDTIVKKELSHVLQHLVQLGVKGIRLKNTKFFILSKQIKDEVPAENPKYDLTQYGFWTHTQTTFQEGLGDVLYDYLTVVKNATEDGFLSVADDVIRPEVYRTSSGDMGIDIPLYGKFVKTLSSPKDKDLRGELTNIVRESGDHTWLQWNVGDADATSEVPPSSVILFLSLLPGTPVVPVGTGAYGSGLSDAIAKQIETSRMSPSYMHGDFSMLPIEPLVGYTRIKSGNPGFLVLFNPTDVTQAANVTDNSSLPDKMTVVSISDNYNVTNVAAKNKIVTAELEVSPYSTIILTYVPVKME